MRLKYQLMDEMQMRRTLIRMSHEIIERNRGVKGLQLIGIQRRGVTLAEEISQIIKTVEGLDVPVGVLDITWYRDDLSLVTEHPCIKGTDIPFNITDTDVILVDDVLYTGRTVRAAIDALIEMGRPKSIQLAVLVDRGNRELPIGADFVGKDVPSSKDELISVSVKAIDGENRVDIYSLKD